MGVRKHELIDCAVPQGAIPPYRIVKYGTADGTVTLAIAVTDKLCGTANNLGATATDRRVDIIKGGIGEVEFGGNVTRGDWLTTDDQGRAITASTGNRTIGMAEVSGVSGDIGSYLFAPGKA
jgi:hypothetical protein